MIQFFLDDDSNLEWTLRYGRSAALSVALKESAGLLWAEEYQARTQKTLLNQLAADKVLIIENAIRSCGYLLQYLMLNDEQLPVALIVPFVKVRKHYFNGVSLRLYSLV